MRNKLRNFRFNAIARMGGARRMILLAISK
jgi:hypothetical protein